MMDRRRDSALADLEHELSSVAAELRINNEQLEREGTILDELRELIDQLKDKGCETDVQNVDYQDGVMLITIITPELYEEIGEILKKNNAVDENIRYSETADKFKCTITLYFQIIEEIEPGELEF